MNMTKMEGQHLRLLLSIMKQLLLFMWHSSWLSPLIRLLCQSFTINSLIFRGTAQHQNSSFHLSSNSLLVSFLQQPSWPLQSKIFDSKIIIHISMESLMNSLSCSLLTPFIFLFFGSSIHSGSPKSLKENLNMAKNH